MNALHEPERKAKSAEVAAPVGPSAGELGAHRVMVTWLFLATTVLIAGLIARLTVFRTPDDSFLLVVVCAGALGGFVSCLRRLYAFEDLFPRARYSDLFKNVNLYVLAYSSIPPLVGMIAAAVVYLIFASDFLQGPAFPKFVCTAKDGLKCSTFQTFMDNWSPDGPHNYAKALVWGFFSGFSERFFVDILGRFTSEKDQSGKPRREPQPDAHEQPDRERREQSPIRAPASSAAGSPPAPGSPG